MILSPHRFVGLSFSLVALCLSAANADVPASARLKQSFNESWLFQKIENQDARFPETYDKEWHKVDLPHPSQSDQGNLSSDLESTDPKPAWYRKHFSLPRSQQNKRVSLQFDGADHNSQVWINGHSLSNRISDSSGFSFDITRYIKFGREEENVVSLKVAPHPHSSFCAHTESGIYRSVWLTFTHAIHVAPSNASLKVKSLDDEVALLEITTPIANTLNRSAQIDLTTRIYDPNGQQVAQTSRSSHHSAESQENAFQEIRIRDPQRWDITSPRLYKAVTTLSEKGKERDALTTHFGLRQIEYIDQKRLQLNGRRVELKGIHLHHDQASLASSDPERMKRQLQKLKKLGTNTLRIFHNAHSPELLSLCDTLGLLVQVDSFACPEIKRHPSSAPQDFFETLGQQRADLILRNSNHPSIITWDLNKEPNAIADPQI